MSLISGKTLQILFFCWLALLIVPPLLIMFLQWSTPYVHQIQNARFAIMRVVTTLRFWLVVAMLLILIGISWQHSWWGKILAVFPLGAALLFIGLTRSLLGASGDKQIAEANKHVESLAPYQVLLSGLQFSAAGKRKIGEWMSIHYDREQENKSTEVYIDGDRRIIEGHDFSACKEPIQPALRPKPGSEIGQIVVLKNAVYRYADGEMQEQLLKLAGEGGDIFVESHADKIYTLNGHQFVLANYQVDSEGRGETRHYLVDLEARHTHPQPNLDHANSHLPPIVRRPDGFDGVLLVHHKNDIEWKFGLHDRPEKSLLRLYNHQHPEGKDILEVSAKLGAIVDVGYDPKDDALEVVIDTSRPDGLPSTTGTVYRLAKIPR